jgi:Arc/MetJ-type ribon-helix-helix transcriptional regulator
MKLLPNDRVERRTERATLGPAVARSLHVRLDDASVAALDVLRAEGMNDSDAVRSALREAASKRRTGAALREEAARLAAHPGDREEVRAILELMDELAPGDED